MDDLWSCCWSLRAGFAILPQAQIVRLPHRQVPTHPGVTIENAGALRDDE